MSNKRRAQKDESQQNAVVNQLPARLEQEDLLKVQITFKEAENARLRSQLGKLQLEKLETEAETASNRLSTLNEQVNQKYQLVVGKDRFDLSTGQITRG